MVDQFINQVIHGDCVKLLKRIPDESVDVTFADPPFNLKKGYNKYRDDLGFEKYLDWCREWIEEMVRVTKPTGSIFIHNIPRWLTYYTGFLNEKADFRHWISWDAPSSPMGKSLQPAHYGILFYAKSLEKNKYYEVRHPHKRCRRCNFLLKDYGGKKSSLHPFGPLVSDVWTDIHRVKHNKYRDKHPCQLPVHLVERLILMSSDEGDIILDPFIGTGTSAIAAKRLGRNYIGFDDDDKYVRISRNKLLQEECSTKIGDSWVSYYLKEIFTIRDVDWDALCLYYTIPKDIERIDFVKIRPG